jgi:proline iminopeptidase
LKTIAAVLLSICLSQIAFAATVKIPTSATYESGHTLCDVKYKDLIAHENGFYVPVPIDYSHPEKGTTDIYAYFNGGYHPERETLLYFTGGPGQTVHWGLFQDEVNFNVLMMEQRGIACSRPEKRDLYLSPEFYSSEFIARDAEKLREFLKIQKVTLFGISYGTIPATMYASIFPDSTRALILEGTVFAGDNLLWSGPHRRKILQKLLNELPAPILDRLKSVSEKYAIPSQWFAEFARYRLMSNDGLQELKAALLQLEDENSFQSLIREMQNTYSTAEFEAHPLFIQNDIPYYMLSCSEMQLGQPGITTTDSLIDGRKLIPQKDIESPLNCASLQAKPTSNYQAVRYPVKVPVTYFQGSNDTATVIPQAIHHYKEVAKGPKQLLILKGGGHNPNLQSLSRGIQGQAELFNAAFHGQMITKAQVETVNQDSDLKWVFTSKP